VHGYGPMSKDEFLNQFPKTKIQEGKAVPIREELEKRFQETQKIDVNKLNSNEPITVETHVKEGTDPSLVVNLRIRTETGKRNIIIKLLATDQISQVYKLVTPYIEGKSDTRFELRTNFPNRSYNAGDAKTLKELGLAPSSALIIKPI